MNFPKYANHHGYSDIKPYEIVKVVSDKTLVVRPMHAEFDESAIGDLQFLVGGFGGHCVNQHAQKWIITPAPQAETMRIRLTKKGWRHGSMRFELSDSPIKFYDYNF